MSKLITMEEAAKMLGISVDRLSEMRSNNEIFAYRDGISWKFKQSEIERVADELGINLKGLSGDAEDSDFDLDLNDDSFKVTDSVKDLLLDFDDSQDDNSSLSGLSGISEFDLDLGEDDSDSSRKPADADYDEVESVELMEDSSIELVSQDDAESLRKSSSPAKGKPKGEPESIEIELADSGILAKNDAKRFRDDHDIVPSDESVIDDEEELSFGSSSIRLASGSSLKLSGDSDKGSVLDDDDGDSEKSPSDTGKMLADDQASLELSDDDLFGDDLELADSFEESVDLSSDFTDSGDLILDDSDSSNEVKLEGNDSGINLSANDSGIMLVDDEMDSAGGSDIDSLELVDEEDELFVVEEGSSEDEFNLTPLADPLEDEDSTGSQVIALEDSEIYADESSDSLLGGEEFEAEPVLVDDNSAAFAPGFGPGGFGPDSAGMHAGTVQVPEAPFSIWNVLALAVVVLFMLMGSMIAYEACQNMWMPDDSISRRGVLSFFLGLGGG